MYNALRNILELTTLGILVAITVYATLTGFHHIIKGIFRTRWVAVFIDTLNLPLLKRMVRKANEKRIKEILFVMRTIPDGFRKRVIMKALNKRIKEFQKQRQNEANN